MGLRDRVAFVREDDVTLGNFLERLAAAHGDVVLVEEAPLDDAADPLHLTFAEAAATVARWAGGVAARIGVGDRVVVALPNGYALFLLSLAVGRAGGVAVPVNPKMRDDEIAHVVDDSGARVVVRDPAEVEGEAPLGSAVPADSGDVAALFYTSGTTGKPKGAQLSHRAVVGRAQAGALYPSGLLHGEAVSGMPVAHIAGFSMLVALATMGVPVYLLRKFRPDTALSAIEQRRAAMFVGVPAMYRMMAEAGADERDLSSVRVWASGADAMPVDLARRFQRFGGALRIPGFDRTVGGALFLDGYGMVELGGGVAVKVLPPWLPARVKGLVGVPMPGYEMAVVDDRGERLPRGEVGELVVKGPGVMRGYHGRDEATAEAMTPDGWMRTGDLARQGRLGLVDLAGRKKDVIKHGGYSVFAREVEAVLEEHPGVAEAALIGLPDERKGEVPVAVVRAAAASSGVDENELIAWAKERMSDYKVPQQVRVVDDLPRTGTDKVRKQDLAALFTDPPEGTASE